jgi:O-antigen ligase
LLGFCALLIGAYSKLVLLGLLPLFVFVILAWRKGHLQFQWHFTQWSWTLLYFFYFIYSVIFWNDDISPKQIEYKLSWLIFPIIFSFVPHFKLEKKYIVLGLTTGVIISSMMGIAKAIYACLTIGVTLTSYTSSNICINHPTYFSATATIALLLLIENWNQNPLKSWPQWIKIILVAFITLMILLSFSMAGFLFIAAASGLVFIHFLIKKETPIKLKLLMIAFPTIGIMLLSQNDFIKGEFNNTRLALTQYIYDPAQFIADKKQSQNGDEVRLIMWTASFLEIKEHPLGVGPTQIGHHLSQRLTTLQQPQMAQMNQHGEVHYNPHNQYLQMALEIGWIPLCIFIMMLINFIAIGIKNNSHAISTIVLLLGFHCLFESILQRQSGIVTFTFIISFYILYLESKSKKEINHVA